jgi:hypothetical protein
VAEALGADVTWREEDRTVIIVLNGIRLELPIGEMLPGMDVAAFIYEDRTFVPVRFIAEHLGAFVTWDAETQTVTIIAKD